MITTILTVAALLAIPCLLFASNVARANFLFPKRKPWEEPGLLTAANDAPPAPQPAPGTHNANVRRAVAAAVAQRNLLFKQGADAFTVAIAAATDLPLGTIDNLLKPGESGTLNLLGKGGTKLMVASAAIPAGAQVALAAGGKIQAAASLSAGWLIGTALTAATAADQLVEVADCSPVAIAAE